MYFCIIFRYKNCIETLNQLEKTVGKNCSKIVHNKAVASFYEEGCKNTSALLTVLQQENLTFLSNSCIQQSLSISKYNLAVIYFNEKKYIQSIETLKVLIDNLENIYESTAGKIGVLFLHLLLNTNKPQKADSFLNTLLKTLNIEVLKDESLEFSAENKGITTNCDVELRSMLQALKIHLMILNKETFHFPEEIPKSRDLEVLQALHFYLKGELKSASKCLMNNECHGESEFYDIFLNNNMGVLQFSNKKLGIAENFFQNALKYDKQLYTKINSLPTYCIGKILY